MNISSFLILIIAISCFDKVKCSCSWNLNNLSRNLPILLNSRAQWYEPIAVPVTTTVYNLRFDSGELLIAVCNGNNNYVQFPGVTQNTQIKTIKCVNDNRIEVDGVVGDVRSLQCTKLIDNGLYDTGATCVGPEALRGKMLTIGFRAPPSWLGQYGAWPTELAEYLTMCYDSTTYNTPPYASTVIEARYTKSTLNGKGIRAKYTGVISENFRNAGTNVQIATWNNIYNERNQYDNLKIELGEINANLYMSYGRFFSRGHLSPNADNIFPYTQKATYFYVNTAPLWQSINTGTWIRIENAVRRLAVDRNETLTIYTGTYQQLHLNSTVGTVREPIYLRDYSQMTTWVIVPKYFWKLVCAENDHCISYVTLNDPTGGVRGDELICNDISNRNLWNPTPLSSGRGACCRPTELFQNMGWRPPHTILTNLLDCSF